jgi:pimeloyl-ACP methyl ester carboxylesterase
MLVDVGGYRLHVQILGSGSPAAVMDSGLGGNSLAWGNALPAVAEITQAVAFDRAGYAWSEPAPSGTPRHSGQLVAELRLLLRGAGVLPPYILVGHSVGAIHALVFAKTHPQEVAGLVLVDPSHPEMMERIPGVPSAKTMERSMGSLALLGRLGLLRLLSPLLLRQLFPNGKRQFSPATWQALQEFASRERDYTTATREAGDGAQSFAMARSAPGSLGDLPIDVLIAEWWVRGSQTAMKKAAAPLHAELAALSSRGRTRIVAGCSHGDLPAARPDEVANAVRRVIEQGKDPG